MVSASHTPTHTHTPIHSLTSTRTPNLTPSHTYIPRHVHHVRMKMRNAHGVVLAASVKTGFDLAAALLRRTLNLRYCAVVVWTCASYRAKHAHPHKRAALPINTSQHQPPPANVSPYAAPHPPSTCRCIAGFLLLCHFCQLPLCAPLFHSVPPCLNSWLIFVPLLLLHILLPLPLQFP
jgi:hypothetical protein